MAQLNGLLSVEFAVLAGEPEGQESMATPAGPPAKERRKGGREVKRGEGNNREKEKVEEKSRQRKERKILSQICVPPSQRNRTTSNLAIKFYQGKHVNDISYT